MLIRKRSWIWWMSPFVWTGETNLQWKKSEKGLQKCETLTEKGHKGNHWGNANSLFFIRGVQGCQNSANSTQNWCILSYVNNILIKLLKDSPGLALNGDVKGGRSQLPPVFSRCAWRDVPSHWGWGLPAAISAALRQRAQKEQTERIGLCMYEMSFFFFQV